ncbi:hypothetical protein [Streptomyces parvus]|uniref:hypothetical protein n=1 Tax=Streptomyces parvus TaxID=66428 RepID=UPI003693F806
MNQVIVWNEQCACGGSRYGRTEEPCEPDCAGYLPDPVETARATLYAHVDRGSRRDATMVTVLNNGGRSRLFVQDNGTSVPLAPTLHQAIDRDVTEAAHAYARTVYGARRAWPARFTVTRY